MPTGDGKAARKSEPEEGGAVAKPEGKPEPKPEVKADAKPDAKPDAAPKPKRPFTTHEGALAYLAARTNIEVMRPQQVDVPRVFQLERMRALCDALGRPQTTFRSVHIAGSKGKGSTCEMAASCLEACGYTVGVYTSPHLVDISERIRINQSRISPAEFTELLGRAAVAAESLPKSLGECTHFELMTAVAFLHFAEQAVDIAIIEVGMGGRGDATNVIEPAVCGIAAIQLEHTQILGSTLEQIAREKAGIMKRGVPCVCVPQPKEVLAVFRAVAQETGATLDVLGEDIDYSYRFESSPELGPHAKVVVTTARSTFEHLPVPLRGEHQAANCGLALAILDKLRGLGLDTPEGQVALGLARTPCWGRLELVHPRPRVFIDGAHNPESVHALMRAIGSQIKYDSLVAVFGCAADKDIPRMMANLALGADKVIFTRATDSPRAMDPRDLQKKFAEVSSKMTQAAPNVRDALNLAARAVQSDDLIVVTGSFAMAGEAKRLLQERHRQAARAHDAQASGVIREVKPGASKPTSTKPPTRPKRGVSGR